MTAAPTVRFMSHDASRTGSPHLLASLVRWLADNTEIRPQVVLEHGGPLSAALRGAAEVRIVREDPGRGRAETMLLGMEELGLGGTARRVRLERLRLAQRGLAAPDLLWANGAASLRWLDALPAGVPLLAHIHELATGIERSLAGLDPAALLARADLVVAVSDAVADHLVTERSVDPSKVRVHRGWLPEEPSASAPPLRPQGVPDGAMLVASCGTIGWRKGSDLFVMLAQMLGPDAGGRPLHWVWIGDGAPTERARLERDIDARGLAGRVHLVGEQSDPQRWLAGADLFALTSREDPFPLVALEAGAAGRALVAFDSGGVTELLDGDRGATVAGPLDLEGMARLIVTLLSDDAARARLGTSLRQRVLADHLADHAAARLWADAAALLGR